MTELNRREILAAVTALGVGTLPFQRALAAQVPDKDDAPKGVTAEMVQQAEWIAGITLKDDERKRVAATLTRDLAIFKKVRETELPNDLQMALHFDPFPRTSHLHPAKSAPIPPIPGLPPAPYRDPIPDLKVDKPKDDEDLAFASIPVLANLLRKKKISSVELTKFFIERLKKYDPSLLCVVTLTEELALKQAKTADELIAKNLANHILCGIPWGAKDLISYPGYKTTWGAGQYKDQKFDQKATVAARLDEAGAVLVAKLTLGALAMGDQWFGGMTRSPWNQKLGSSGSSAGSASAVAAGLVPFALGSETLGSIVSPSTRCGVTGLRPTFGAVPRTGCMTLCWSMDKIGPMARSAEDTRLVFNTIAGLDGEDLSCPWPAKYATPNEKMKELRIGFFENAGPNSQEAIKILKDLGCKMTAIKLPSPEWLTSLKCILDVESAAAFDHLTRAGVTEGIGMWGNSFRSGQFVTAIDYIRANRLRTRLCRLMEEATKDVDVYIGGNDLFITNLTGHPSICLPSGFAKNGDIETPRAITFTGKLFGESNLISAAMAYQAATDHHKKRPPLDRLKPVM